MARVSRRTVLLASSVAPAVVRAAGKTPPSAPSTPFAHVALSRLAFGPRPGDVEAFQRGGDADRTRLASWVDAQLSPRTLPDDECDAVLKAAKLVTLEKTLEQQWADHWLQAPAPVAASTDGGVALDAGVKDAGTRSDAGVGMAMMTNQPADPRRPRDENERRLQPMREVELATWLRAVHSTRQLNEVLVGFWHDHFSVYGREGQVSATFAHYDRDVLRAHALGNFRVLLEAVAKSPAMLVYLDNFTSQSGNANENFARELFELHTLGAVNSLGTRSRESVPQTAGVPEGSVDGDVYEAARCFTGWRLDQATGAFQYFEPWHDRFQKIVLGRHLPEYQPPMKDGQDVLDLVSRHPGTARFLVKKLCLKLLGAAPQPLVDRTVKLFTSLHADEHQLAKVVRAIVVSDEFVCGQRLAVKRPFEATVAMLRALGGQFFPSEPFLEAYARAGQRLFAWRTPDGYPVAPERWAGSTPMLERFRLANQLCSNALEGVKVDLLTACGKDLTPMGIARRWASRAVGFDEGPTVDAITELLALGRQVDLALPEPLLKERLPGAVALAFMTPGFQWR